LLSSRINSGSRFRPAFRTHAIVATGCEYRLLHRWDGGTVISVEVDGE
jgi:hypothetical protein